MNSKALAIVPDTVIDFALPNGNTFTGLDLETIAEDYTLVTLGTVLIDSSDSMDGQEQVVQEMYNATIVFLKDSPVGDRVLNRLVEFNTNVRGQASVREIHGFAPAEEINTGKYSGIKASGGTPLFEAGHEAVIVSTAYAQQIIAEASVKTNGIITLLTDGEANGRDVSATQFAEAVVGAVGDGKHESLFILIIGINADGYYRAKQEQYALEIQQVLDRTYKGIAEKDRPVRLVYRHSKDFNGKEVGRLIGNITASQSASVGGGSPSQAAVPSL